MEFIKKNISNTGAELIVASLLFLLFLSGIVTFSDIVVNVLSFVVFLEVVKVISGFINTSEHVVQLRTVIDGFIVFFLRDLVLIFSNDKIAITDKEEKVLMVAGILVMLFLFRIAALKYSPNDKNCEQCIVLAEKNRKAMNTPS